MAQSDNIEREFALEHVLPVEEILGKQTLSVVRAFNEATAAILKRPTRPGPRHLPDFGRLTLWTTLTKPQCSVLCEILNDPESYWNGCPVYRRFPPRPGFAIQLSAPSGTAELLIDLHNPGWEMRCGEEEYWGFNFVGPRLTALAKSVFPEYASDNMKSVWKKGVIEKLAVQN